MRTEIAFQAKLDGNSVATTPYICFFGDNTYMLFCKAVNYDNHIQDKFTVERVCGSEHMSQAAEHIFEFKISAARCRRNEAEVSGCLKLDCE